MNTSLQESVIPISSSSQNVTFRQCFKIDEIAHLDCASLGPLSIEAKAGAERCISKLYIQSNATKMDLIEEFFLAIQGISKLFQSNPLLTGIAPSASFILTSILNGWNWGERNTFICSDLEYSSNLLITSDFCNQNGHHLKTVSSDKGWIDYERLMSNIDTDTAAVILSSVQFTTGQIAPIREIQEKCRVEGARLIIDATQSLGILPLNLREYEVDAIYSSTHKWLCSLPAGIFILGEDFGKSLRPLVHSALSYEDAVGRGGSTYKMKENMERFLWGTPDIVSVGALSGACEAFSRVGINHIFNSALEAKEQFSRALITIPGFSIDHATATFPVVRVGCTGNIEKVSETLLESNVLCSLREGALRFSFHGYSNKADINKAIEVLKTSL